MALSEYSVGRRWVAAVYAAILLWINFYICRDLFTARAMHMNSMHGFWIALAKGAQGGWLRADWWPYWDCGIPFQSTYAPLVPALAAAWAVVMRVPHDRAFYSIVGVIYCVAPLTLFFAAWKLTRSAGWSFAATLVYSLTSLTQFLLPDGAYGWAKLWEARRLFLMSTWDDAPHAAALALLPLLVWFLARAMETRRVGYGAAAAATIGAMALASAFGPVEAVLVAVCLLAAMGAARWKSNVVVAGLVGAWGYALAAPYLAPSLLRAIHEASAVNDVEGWNAGSITAAAITAAGWITLWPYLRRAKGWTGRFAPLFAWTAASIPLAAAFGGRHFLPQPARYKLEMELGLALLLAIAASRWMPRAPANWRAGILLVLLAGAGEQVVAFRKIEKAVTFPQDVTRTVEYRAAVWAGENLKGRRILFPGSAAQWANAFSKVQQFSGGSWSMATNQEQQNAHAMVAFGGPGPELSLLWLQAFGVSAVGVSGPGSEEYWKGDAFPKKFEGVLPVLWREQGVTVYGVPRRTESLAHVVSERSVVQRAPRNPEDVGEVRRYVAALEDSSVPAASMEWEGRNRMRVRTSGAAQAVSVQVSYHAGWHASVDGRAVAVRKDGLGLMWMKPECTGACEIVLDYDGGWELRLCRWLSGLSVLGLLAGLVFRSRAIGAIDEQVFDG